MQRFYAQTALALAIAGSLVIAGCSSSNSNSNNNNDDQPIPLGNGNVSQDPDNPNANANVVRMSMAVTATSASDVVDEAGTSVRPLLASYAEQVIGDHELGDGSADIGDPDHVDDVFVSLSNDNGATWKKYHVGKTAEQSSTQVEWDGETIQYPGHSNKPVIEVNGNRIMVAWYDKYCPSGNPLGLVDGESDFFQVNGSQGYKDYTVVEGNVTYPDGFPAPNGKLVFQVPFSCVWTARGIYDTDTKEIDWHQAEQLTTGRRDANKVTLTSAADVGFAITFQEDREGLRAGEGAGPGEGWSGATTNHGSDIWYAYLPMADFDATDIVAEDVDGKPKSLNNFSYPVRVSDNESCKANDSKAYCAAVCDAYVAVADQYYAVNEASEGKCINEDQDDPLVADSEGDYDQLIDGDTGASRPAFKIMMDGVDPVVIMAYEETKGLSGRGTPDDSTNIALEGKMAYFHSFPFANGIDVANPPADLDLVDGMVEPGFPVNLCGPRSPDYTVVDTEIPEQCEQVAGDYIDADGTNQGDLQEIYENARRVVIVSQVDPANEPSDYNFGIMYKQGFDKQGASSDMFIRMNSGFDETGFAPMAINVSAMEELADTDPEDTIPTWTVDNLDDYTWENGEENTFSPRGFIRGNDLFFAFEYTPSYIKWEQGNIPNNFYVHRCVANSGAVDPDLGTACDWQVPQRVTQITGQKVSTLDPRFVPSAADNSANTGLASDTSNPDVIVVTYGTFDQESGDELNLYYTRSTDRGVTWETTIGESGAEVNFTLAGAVGVEEKEVQTILSPDGMEIYNIWLQESEEDADVPDIFKALDVKFGLIECTDLTTCPPPAGDGAE